MKRIGVTGGTGFIGQYLLKEYKDQYEFAVVCRHTSSKELVQADSIEYIMGDYSEEMLLKAFEGCDAIVHLGAKRSDKDNEKAFWNYQENIVFSEMIFSVAKKLGISNVVNISSTAVYSRNLKAPFKESYAADPLSFYGVSKRTIELIADQYNKKYGMCIKSLRFAQVIGEGEREGYILSVFKNRCIDGLALSVYGHGRAGKEYIYVKDAVRGIDAALQNEEKKGIYNIGSGVFTSNRELAEAYCNVFENKAGYQLLTDKPEDVYDYYMDVSLAEQELGFSCKYDLYASIADMKKIIEENRCA